MTNDNHPDVTISQRSGLLKSYSIVMNPPTIKIVIFIFQDIFWISGGQKTSEIFHPAGITSTNTKVDEKVIIRSKNLEACKMETNENIQVCYCLS